MQAPQLLIRNEPSLIRTQSWPAPANVHDLLELMPRKIPVTGYAKRTIERYIRLLRYLFYKNGGRNRDWTCDPYDVNVVQKRGHHQIFIEKRLYLSDGYSCPDPLNLWVKNIWIKQFLVQTSLRLVQELYQSFIACISPDCSQTDPEEHYVITTLALSSQILFVEH